MKIAYVANSETIHTRRWCEFFLSEGHDVNLFAFKKPAWECGTFHKLASLPLIGSTSSVRYFIATVIPPLKRRIRALAPDILIGDFVTSYGVMAALADWHPLLITAHGSDVLVDYAASPFRSWRRVFVLEKADMINSRANHMTDAIAALGISREKILTVYNNVDTSQFSFAPRPASDPPVIVSNRMLNDYYRVDVLVRAMGPLAVMYPNIKCMIAGTGPEMNKLKMIAASSGLKHVIEFAGFIPHEAMPSFLKKGNIFVSVSATDGLPVSLLEAMSVGLIPVVSDIPANRELVVDGKNGYVATGDAPENLAQVVARAITERENWNEMISANRKYVEENADYQRSMRRIMDAMIGLCATIPPGVGRHGKT